MNKQRLIAFTFIFAVLQCSKAFSQDPANDPLELRNARTSYQQQIKSVSEPIKAKYATYLESLKKTLGAKGDVNGALAVQTELDSLGISTGRPIDEGDKLVIWNQNNAGKGDRGTKRINIILFAGGREVTRLTSVPLKWDPMKQTKDEIKIPSVAVEKLRIEILGAVNDRAGLAEIEYIKNGKNIAKDRPVEVSAVWENDKKHEGSMLTDGDPMTYWLVPDSKKAVAKIGWAEISFADKK